jgi:CBS domain-containing protein
VRARDLAEPFPTITPDTEAMAAVRAMAGQRLPGLIVCDESGKPYTIVPGSQVLRFLIPAYVQDDPGLARAFDEDAADQLCRRLAASTVRDLLPHPGELHELPVVDADATSLEVAAVMAGMHSPLVAVTSGSEVDAEQSGGQMLGAITVSRLLEHLLPS